MEHEGAFTRAEGRAVAYDGGEYAVAPLRSGAPVLDDAYLAALGLDTIDATALYGASTPLPRQA